jgi:hypothetical protein
MPSHTPDNSTNFNASPPSSRRKIVFLLKHFNTPSSLNPMEAMTETGPLSSPLGKCLGHIESEVCPVCNTNNDI